MSSLIFKKMSQVMSDIKAVTKDQTNSMQGFKFRGIDQFVNALYPALTKHAVFMTPRCVKYTHEIKEVIRGNGKAGIDKHVELLMEYDFFAEDGSKVTVGPIAAEGLDSGDKATNKALSAALKYALIQTFSIPTADMAEADADSPVIEQPKRVTASSAKSEAVGDLESANSSAISASQAQATATTSSPSRKFGRNMLPKPAAAPTVEEEL